MSVHYRQITYITFDNSYIKIEASTCANSRSDNDTKSYSESINTLTSTQQTSLNIRNRLENYLIAGAATTAVVSGSAIASVSALQPDIDPGAFDHILQKDTPLDQMIILAQHNAGALAGTGTLPLVATNQTMTIEETLETTPVRGFDLDAQWPDGVAVINHGGFFDPTVSENDYPKVSEKLQLINRWLDTPRNQNEVVFLKFSNYIKYRGQLRDIFGRGSVMHSKEYNELYNQLGRSPTISEIRANGYQLAVFDASARFYFGAGNGETGWRETVLPDPSDVHHLDIAGYLDTGVFHMEGLGPTAHGSDILVSDVLDHIKINYDYRLPDDLLFLDFASHDIPHELIDEIFGEDVVLDLIEYNDLYNRYGRDLTVTEIRSEGYRVSLSEITPHEILIGGFSYPTIWEDRSLLEHLSNLDLEMGELTTDDIAGHLTTEDIDRVFQSGEGVYVSLDQISPNDPRFFTPEVRDSLALRPDLKLMGFFYESDQAFQTTLLGFSTASASATGALALAGGAYRGLLNEKKIRYQDKLLPCHLKAMELSGVLQRRKHNKKNNNIPLSQEVTTVEMIKFYKANQLQAITKDTAMAGASATVSLTGSALALGMIFPPLFPVFAGTSLAVAGSGTIATTLAISGNRRRIIKAIDKAFAQPDIHNALKRRVAAMNQELTQAGSASEDIDKFLANMVAERDKGERLLTASTAMLSASLVTRASGMSKYGMPAIGTAAMGVGASITGVLVALSATMNFRDRRSKLKNLMQTTSEVIRPDYGRKQKRKLGLFGDAAFQRFLKKNRNAVLKDLDLPDEVSMKKISLTFSLPGNDQHLAKHLRLFAEKEWLKDLGKFAGKQKPAIKFDAIKNDPVLLNPFLKKYVVNRVADFAHNDTFRAGRSGTLRLALIGAFSGIFFLPMLGVAAGGLAIGMGVTKGVAVHERRLFKRKLGKLLEEAPTDGKPEERATHDSLHQAINCWSKMLTSINKPPQ